MTEHVEAPSTADGGGVYERDVVDRFFVASSVERARLLSELATARRRIADARASWAVANDESRLSIDAVLDAQRLLREERRANDRAVAALYAEAEARAEQLLHDARTRVPSHAASRRDHASTTERRWNGHLSGHSPA